MDNLQHTYSPKIIAPAEYHTQSTCHYVYRITNTVTGMHYYGVKTKKLNRNAKYDRCLVGINYFSSFTKSWFEIDQKNNPQNYRYKVVRIFETRASAVAHESFLHAKFDVKNHPKFVNEANQTSNGFDTTGLGSAKCSITGKRLGSISLDDPRWATGEIVGTTYGTQTDTAPAILYETGESLGRVYRDDPRWATGEIISTTIGKNLNMATAVCPLTLKSLGKIDCSDPRWVTGEIVGCAKGKTANSTVARCTTTGEIVGRIHNTDPRWNTGEIQNYLRPFVLITDGIEFRRHLTDGTDEIPNGWTVHMTYIIKKSKFLNVYSEDGVMLHQYITVKEFANSFGLDRKIIGNCVGKHSYNGLVFKLV